MTPTKNTSGKRVMFRARVRIIFAFVLLLVLLIFARLYYLQIMHGEEYRSMAEGQYVSKSAGFYDRGDIFFTDKSGKEISGATVKSGYILAINPSLIQNADALYDKINSIVPIDAELYARAAAKSSDPYEELVKRITKADGEELLSLDERGVILVPQRWRYYPGDDLASSVLGFVAYDVDEQVGRYGLESYWEDVLKREGSSLNVNFFAELFANVRDIIFVSANKREGDIVTSIEPSVQLKLQEELTNIDEAWSPEMVAGIIMDSNTGSIVGMGSTPTFDLNNYASADPELYPNIFVERVYEMGSIIKPLTVAAGIDSGAITAKSKYNDKGYVKVGGSTIYNYDKKARGVVDMQEVLSHSLNVGAVFAQQQMGNDTFRRYMYRFGLNEETGVDLPHESLNLVSNLETSRDIEYATASFGQGIALTPISTARALCALGTGYLPQPHLVEKIRSVSGLVNDKDYSNMRVKVLKESTVEDVSRLMVNAVDTNLLGGTLKLEHYSVAAKTGTAQMPKPSGGYYDDDQVLHTFVGYFPAYDPQFLILLMAVRPHDAPYASDTLARPFFDLTKYLINYYDIPPDR